MLLANAMDPNFKEQVRPAYVSILKDLSPLDAVLLGKIASSMETPKDSFSSIFGGSMYVIDDFAKALDANPREVELSIFNLSRLGCMSPIQDMDGNVKYVTTETYSASARFVVTPLGQALIRSCTRQ